jgi:dolichol kinase
MTELESVDYSYTAEIVRKGIHLSSLAIPVVYYFLSRSTALTILIPLTLAFLLSDLTRLFFPAIGRLHEQIFGWLLRTHERLDRGRHLTGATYVLLSAVLCVWIFPKVIVITSFAILIISDSAAALIGRRFGNHPFLAKSLEGSFAFFSTALIVVALAPKIANLPGEYLIGTAAAVLGTLVEAAGLDIDDNLSIPLSIGTALWLLYAAFLPTLDLYALDKLV